MNRQESPSEWPRVARHVAAFLALVAIAWVGLAWAWDRFPYFRNGTEIIIEAKLGILNAGQAFAQAKPDVPRVAVCGHSLVLSGFIPSLFDELSGGQTFSFNLGVPGQTGFDEVETIITQGTPPTHLFLQIPWPEKEFQPTIWKWFESDKPIVQAVFPFRNALRDLAVFAALAPSKGGLAELYQFGKLSARRVVDDRGHFLIEANLYPNEILPDDFTHPDDTPDEVRPRVIIPTGRRFARLRELADKYNVRFYFVPSYVREHYAAPPPPINTTTQKDFKNYPNFQVIGPDYFRYPNRLFCDRVHVNEEGAKRYTQDLWETTKSLFPKNAKLAERAPRPASVLQGRSADAL